MAHKQARTGSSSADTETLPSPSNRSEGAGPVGQHHHMRVHQQVGGDEIPPTVLASMGPGQLVHSEQCAITCNTCARCGQCAGRFPVEAGNRPEGVGTASTCCEHVVQDLGETQHRSVCVSAQPQTDSVLLPVPVPCGDLQGRVLLELGKLLQRVCVPTNGAHTESASEGPAGPSTAHPHSTLVAQEALVPGATESADSSATGASSETGSVSSVQSATSRPGRARTSGVEDQRRNLRARGFSEDVIGTMLASRAKSTTAAYNAKWKIFKRWCRRQHLDSHATTVAQICQFMQFRFDEGLQYSTIKGDVAAIAAYHRRFQRARRSLGRDTAIKAFLRGGFWLRPPVKEIVPKWELSLVLQALNEAPFEPARNASLQAWTMKTVFLLAITSAARVGELQALDSHEDLLTLNRYRAILHLNPAFLPKVVNVVYINRQIDLEAFHPVFQTRLEKKLHTLCPVRALRWYLEKTKPIRVDRQLLVSYQAGRQGKKVNKATVARWIRQTVVYSYNQMGRELPLRSVRAHDTRAQAASFADLKGVAPADLCAAATWSSVNVFAKFYRLDLASGKGISTQVLSAAVSGRHPTQ